MIRRALSLALLAFALPGLALAASRQDPPGSVDDELIQMGRTIPGFGGLFYDAEGVANVYLRDPQAPVALAALKSLGGEVRVRQGEYDFAQLVEWKRALRQTVLGQPEVVYLDADEARNRVVVGIDAAQSRNPDTGRLDKLLAAQGVPRQAVLYQTVPALRELTGIPIGEARAAAPVTLLDRIRPVPGGAALSFTDSLVSFGCTIGFNAYLGKAFGFVTNSHCSTDRGVVDGTSYYQGWSLSGGVIGTEIADAPYFTGSPCPAQKQCRYSDSAFAQYTGNSTKLGSFRKLARPSSRGALEGSSTLKPAASRFNVVGVAAAPLIGQVVNKIGVTSGWTYGPVVSTCVEANVVGSPYELLCQHIVQAGAGHGDSGSPVFSWTTGNNVSLVGILWGGGSDDQGNQVFAFSPLASIQSELGALRVK